FHVQAIAGSAEGNLRENARLHARFGTVDERYRRELIAIQANRGREEAIVAAEEIACRTQTYVERNLSAQLRDIRGVGEQFCEETRDVTIGRQCDDGPRCRSSGGRVPQ